MRAINLLPTRYRPAQASGDRPGIGYAALGALAVLFVMVLLYVLTSNSINDAEEKTAIAENESAVARARIGQLQAYGDFAALKTNREASVKTAAQLRFDYERLMRELALVMPKNTYLTSFAATSGAGAAASTAPATGQAAAATTATGTGPSLSIAGCSPTHPDVATTIVRMRKLHNVTDVNLTNSSKGGATDASATAGEGACDVSWTATVAFEAESAPTVEESVPARLGGGQ